MKLHVPTLPIVTEPHGDDEWILASGATFGLVDLRVVWPVGTASDGANAGLTAVAWEMLERGTVQRDRVDFHAALERLGASLQFRAYRQSTQLALRVLEEYLDDALDLLAEALVSPRDDAEEFAELLQENEEAVDMALESPEGAVSRYVAHASWKEAPWSLPSDGTRATRAQLRVEQLAPQRARVLQSRAWFGVAADDPPALHATLARFQARIRDAYPAVATELIMPPPRQWGTAHRIPFEAQQGALTVISDGPDPRSPHWPAIALHSTAFGDGFGAPLVHGLRARDGLSYDVGWSLYPEHDRAVHVFRCHPESARLSEAYRVANEIWASDAAEPPDPEALERAKATYIGARLVSMETAERRLVAATIMRTLDLPIERLWTLPAAVSEVTPQAVADAAFHYAWGTDNRIVVAAVAPGDDATFGALNTVQADLEAVR